MIVSIIQDDQVYTTTQAIEGIIEEPFTSFKAYIPISKITIGRSSLSTLVIPSSFVSSQHAIIYQSGDQWYIQDLNSANGTFVNGQRITTHQLQIGDLIYIMTFRIVWMDSYLLIIQRDHYLIHLDLYTIPLSQQYSQKSISLEKEDLIIDLELPSILHSNKQTPMIYTIGPALTMSMTMLLSVLVSYLTSSNLSYSSIVITIGMLCSMSFWPFLQRRNERKRNNEERIKREKNYLHYLDSIQVKINELLEQEKQYYLQSTKYVIGYTNRIVNIQFNHSKISYEMEDDPLILKLKEILDQQYMIHDIYLPLNYLNYHVIYLTGHYKYEWLIYFVDELLDDQIPVYIELNELSFLKYDAFLSDKPSVVITHDLLAFQSGVTYFVLDECKADYHLEINDHHYFPSISENDFLRHSFQYLHKESTILDLLHIQSIDELDLSIFYLNHHTYHSLEVPLSSTFSLDLHEKGNGPHGLLAGMTGSGKSELIITLVTMLCLNYSPEELSIVIIDYKGGGLSESFSYQGQRLPHLVNTINNLNQEDLVRGIYGLKNELKRRMLLFDQVKKEYHLNRMDIDYYQKLSFRPPLCHILIIVDEFAELKATDPDLIEEIIHIARIGRSLGIHLLLSTQKPSGVINQQIWSNTNYHICMKVADPSDSLEMIHSKESAYLTRPGEFYIQYGSNPQLEKGSILYLGNESVQRTLTGDLPLHKSDSEHIIQKIIEYCTMNHLVSSPIWLPPITHFPIQKYPSYTFGLIDDYYHSTYTPLVIEKGKHYLFVGLSIEEKEALQNIVIHYDGKYIEAYEPIQDSILLLDYPFSNETSYHQLLNTSHTLFVMLDHTYTMRLSEYKYFDERYLFNFESEEYRNLFGKTMKCKEKKIRYKGLMEKDEVIPFMLGGIE